MARDTLLSPAKRFAYERFGPGTLEWKSCTTKLEFIQAGLLKMVPFYVAIAGTLMVVSYFGYVEYGRYVRFALSLVLTWYADEETVAIFHHSLHVHL
jgi:hypothetical protein